MNRMWMQGVMAAVLAALVAEAPAAGLLKVKGAPDNGLKIHSHFVDVTLNNGFARTEVDQVFTNTTANDMEAVYSFPLPKQASLSELSLWIDGREVLGEVTGKEKARKIYEEQVAQGKETALAEKNDFINFDVSVGLVRANDATRVRLVYYQPLEIDLNVGRYLYPLAEGNVDDARIPFWSVDDTVTGPFRFTLTLKSAFPVKDVRLPGFENEAVVAKDESESAGNGSVYVARLERADASTLAKDIVFYYRLDDTVPARVELVPYRAAPSEPGTFMLVVTPAADLKRIAEGTDWIFVLDVSGSMGGDKIRTLGEGVARILGKMSPNDRFRLITFNQSARDVTGRFVQATPEEVSAWIERAKNLTADGGTDIFSGLKLAYDSLEEDRTAGVILVTDGVCNVGQTTHKAFLDLLRQYDIRLFTFVIGNGANQPLMDRLALDSGGFALNIGPGDDLVGRLIQAKAKILHECMHDVQVKFHGEKVRELTPAKIGNLYMGQQLVLFGHYTGSGEVEVELTARISGEARSWRCRAVLPETDTENPELERLWALSAIDETMAEIRELGETDARTGRVRQLGEAYSLVTDYTSMLVVRDEVFENQGIARANAGRVATERAAQQVRSTAPVRNHTVDNTPANSMFGGRSAPGLGTGPVGPLFVVVAGWLARRRKQGVTA